MHFITAELSACCPTDSIHTYTIARVYMRCFFLSAISARKWPRESARVPRPYRPHLWTRGSSFIGGDMARARERVEFACVRGLWMSGVIRPIRRVLWRYVPGRTRALVSRGRFWICIGIYVIYCVIIRRESVASRKGFPAHCESNLGAYDWINVFMRTNACATIRGRLVDLHKCRVFTGINARWEARIFS